jgi:hypothetical protein
MKALSPSSKKVFNTALSHVRLALFFHKVGGYPIYSHEWPDVLDSIYRKVDRSRGLTIKERSAV